MNEILCDLYTTLTLGEEYPSYFWCMRRCISIEKRFLYTGKKIGKGQWDMENLEEREWHRKKQRKEENVIPETVKENWGFLENALQIMTRDPDGSTA